MKYKKCCLRMHEKTPYTANQSQVHALLDRLVPGSIGSADENSKEFQLLEDWANRYLSGIDCYHPLFGPLSDDLCTHGEIIEIARKQEIHDYLAVAEPLYVEWLNS